MVKIMSMKATDLMVGDWLNIYTFPNDNPKQDDLFPAKVSAVSVFDPFFDPDDVIVELVIERTKGIASRPLGTCLPIPLTEDILVKNGFEHTMPHNDYALGELSLYEGGNGYIVNGFVGLGGLTVHCDYVHTLQHLLRLAGIEKEIEL